MANTVKHDQILDALQNLLAQKDIRNISVSEIAQEAGIGKGSIYYYFPSKDAILESLIERSYEIPLHTAKELASQSSVSAFTRMAMIFQACRTSSSAFQIQSSGNDKSSIQERSHLHEKYMQHIISELKPTLTEIIRQGIEAGDIHFDYPAALSEIVLIVLTVKLDNTLVPSTREEMEDTLRGLVSLLEKGTGAPEGTLNYLTAF